MLYLKIFILLMIILMKLMLLIVITLMIIIIIFFQTEYNTIIFKTINHMLLKNYTNNNLVCSFVIIMRIMLYLK